MKKEEISAKTFELIGRLSIAFNSLEFMTSFLFNAFKISSKTGLTIIDEIGFPTLLKKIKSYSKDLRLPTENINEINDLLDKIDEMREQRNSYVHAMIPRPDSNSSEKAILFYESIRENRKVEKEISHRDLERMIKECQGLGIQTIYLAMNIEKIINKKGA